MNLLLQNGRIIVVIAVVVLRGHGLCLLLLLFTNGRRHIVGESVGHISGGKVIGHYEYLAGAGRGRLSNAKVTAVVPHQL